uniref:Uncharacterized protein n=1 Tax=Callorhinchus milii TaxID=7868 RepID=A0A4W3GWV3_CALMI
MEEAQKGTREADNPEFKRTSNAPPTSKRVRHCSDFSGVVCCVLSIFSLGFCILVHFRTSDLQTRVINLENERQPPLSAWLSVDRMEVAILSRVDQLVDEKLKAHLPKVRLVRDAPSNCLCPPGYMTSGY